MLAGGQDKPAWTACPPGVKITRVGGKISRDSLPPGGQAVQGGKINCYTGTCDFQQCGILTSVDSDEPVQPPIKLRNSKWHSVSSLTVIEYSSDLAKALIRLLVAHTAFLEILRSGSNHKYLRARSGEKMIEVTSPSKMELISEVNHKCSSHYLYPFTHDFPIIFNQKSRFHILGLLSGNVMFLFYSNLNPPVLFSS